MDWDCFLLKRSSARISIPGRFMELPGSCPACGHRSQDCLFQAMRSIWEGRNILEIGIKEHLYSRN